MNRRIFDLCKEIAAVNSGSIGKAIDDARAKIRHSKSGSDYYCYPRHAGFFSGITFIGYAIDSLPDERTVDEESVEIMFADIVNILKI